MKKISTVLDYIIASLFFFLVMLVFFGSFSNGYFPVILSLLSLAIFSALFFKIRGGVFLKKARKSEHQKKQKLVETSLLYQTKAECLSFFAEFFEKVFALKFSERNGYLQSEETFVFDCFESIEIGFSELLKASKIAREQNFKHLIVLCVKNSCDHDFLASMFETVSVFTSANLYDKMIDYDFFPKMIDEKILPKKSIKSTFMLFISRKKARGFGILGVMFFFFALISPFSTYYLIFSCILLLFSAFLILFKKT